jgi:hypothetical protein
LRTTPSPATTSPDFASLYVIKIFFPRPRPSASVDAAITRKILSEANESRAGKGGRRRTQRYVEVDFDEHVSVANEKTFAVV